MFKAIKKPKSPNILWDASRNCPLCKFVDGTYKTEDGSTAEKLKSMGYQVEEETEEAEGKEKKEKRKGK